MGNIVFGLRAVPHPQCRNAATVAAENRLLGLKEAEVLRSSLMRYRILPRALIILGLAVGAWLIFLLIGWLFFTAVFSYELSDQDFAAESE
jgi:hypothetical protein